MSQTLTKPVLLDETGQDIVDKLDEIKDAISTGSEFTPVMIKVTTPPLKTAYRVGETLELAGIVVSLIASNGVQVDVTEQCTFSPANGTTVTAGLTSVAISYYWYRDDVTFTTSYPIGVKSLSSIAITTPPTVTEYMVGDELDLTGMVVTASYDDGTFLDVTQNCTFSPADGTVLAANNTSVTVTYTEGSTTKTATQALTINAIYGAEWDGTSSSAWTRTDAAASFTDPIPAVSNGNGSSPFDTIQPWAGMERVEDANAGTLVKIPKFYYKWTFDGAKMKLQISMGQAEGFLCSPAHMDRDDGHGERDFVYVGAYHCASDYKSKTGVIPVNNITRATARTNIHNLGSDIWQYDYAMYWTIMMLYLVEFADWNSQAKIGYGCGNNSSAENVGLTDSMVYHTGTAKSSRSTVGVGTKYRHIEGLWDNVFDWCDGTYRNSNQFGIYLNPADFADNGGGTSYIATGQVPTLNSSNLITKWAFNYYGQASEDIRKSFAITPSTLYTGAYSADTYDTYVCDSYYNLGGQIATGAGYNTYNGKQYGAFCFFMASSARDDVGCRLMKLPNS